MRYTSLPWRNLFYYGRANFAVGLGVLVGTAVLTGALLIGDSLKGSLRDLILQRLGRIDLALVSERFFMVDLAERFQKQSPGVDHVAPVILLRGTVLRRDAQGRVSQRAGQVQVIGVEPSFWPLFGLQREDLGIEYAVNGPLAQELDLKAGDRIEVRLEKPQAIPVESFLHRRDRPEGVLLEPAPVREIFTGDGPAKFSLAAQQMQPRTVYVPLRKLQRRLALEQPSMATAANGLLVTMKPGVGTVQAVSDANAVLRETARLEDLGLTLRQDHSQERYLSLESRRMIVEPEVVAAVQKIAEGKPWKVVPTTTYLANLITHAERYPRNLASAIAAHTGHIHSFASACWLVQQAGSYTPYSAITGLDVQAAPPFGPLLLKGGQRAPELKEDEILLSEFIAQDFWPLGDWQRDLGKPIVRIHYFVEGDGYLLTEKTATLKFAGVVPLAGVARDRTLTPEFPGLKGNSIRDWDPPFPKSQWHPKWWRDRDEQFYRRERVTPKAFVSPATAHKLWHSKLGEFTSVRIGVTNIPRTVTPVDLSWDLSTLESAVREALREALPPKAMGLDFLPVKELGLRAAGSSTAEMFGWLFVSFSFFLIASAVMLVGLLFRLGIERRAKELGLYFAVGYSLRKVRWLLLLEGLFVAVLGGLVGVVVALGYARLLLNWMRRGWAGSLESSFLSFHFTAESLTLGLCISVFIAVLTIVWSLRILSKMAPSRLLAGAGGWDTVSDQTASGRWGRIITVGAFIGAIILAGISFAVPPQTAPGLFFGSGALLLIGGLGAVRIWLRKQRQTTFAGVGAKALAELGASNAGRTPGRSLLTAGLLACGVFLVVSVESFRKGPEEATSKTSGAGGFTLLAEADNPLPTAPNDPREWRELTQALFLDEDRAPPTLPAGVTLYGCRLRQGDDVSCLNLYQPLKPRILGVPAALIQRGGFSFALPSDVSDAERQNPWTLLQRQAEKEVPILADDHTAQWILQKGIGDVWELHDERGQPFQVKLVGMVKGSIFQSELLMSEENFRRLFPSQGGYRFFLIDTGVSQPAEVKQTLETAFGEWFGFNVSSTQQRLAAFHAVENTYISTFQALGGLGVLLGTIGLGVVLLRNINERQRELALLRALGYSRKAIAWLVLAENFLLILLGLIVGVAAAFLAIMPSLRSDIGQAPWGSIAQLVLLVPVVGLFAGSFALLLALRTPLLAALRRE